MGAENVLEARAVTVRFSGANRAALASMSLGVAAGEIVALLGANGAGKTTLLRAFSGSVALGEGEVLLRGAPLTGIRRPVLARELAVVAQSEDVALGFTVREVVMMGRAPHQGTWLTPSSVDRDIVEQALARCDLLDLAGRPADALSGGEKKRVQVARALAQRPRVLLLDEPAASLDVRHALELCDLLAEQVREHALACVVVLHDLNLASQYADRVALLHEGRLLASGKVDDVMTAEGLRAAFGVDLHVTTHVPSGSRFFLPLRTDSR